MRTILLCLMIPLSGLLLAQDLPTVHQTYRWNSTEGKWALSNEYRYTYDDRDSIQQRIELLIGWTLSGRIEDREVSFRFDREGNEIYRLRRLREPGANWVNNRRDFKKTNAQGEEIETFERWRDKQWETYRSIRRNLQTIGGEQVRNSYYEELQQDGSFRLTTQDSSILDAKGRTVRQWKYGWNEPNGARNPISYYEVEYSAQGEQIYNRVEILNASPIQILEFRRSYQYDAQGRLLEMKEERRNNINQPEWQVICLEQNAYDLQGRLMEEYHQNLMDKARKLYEYQGDTITVTDFRGDAQADLQARFRKREIPHPRHQDYFLYQKQERWEEGAWDFGKEEIFEFTEDKQGNIATVYRRSNYKFGSREGKYLRFEREYDSQDRVLSEIKYQTNPLTKEEYPMSREVWMYDVSEPASQNAFLLYPQPNQGEVNIQLLRQNSPAVGLRVFDQGGRLVYSQALELNQAEADFRFWLEELPGLYLVQIQYQDGSTHAQKLLLE